MKETYPDKNIWIYSGSTLEELLNRQDKVTNEILKNVNILVDGRFALELKDLRLKFRGSSNQRIINMEEYFKMKNRNIEFIKTPIGEREIPEWISKKNQALTDIEVLKKYIKAEENTKFVDPFLLHELQKRGLIKEGSKISDLKEKLENLENKNYSEMEKEDEEEDLEP